MQILRFGLSYNNTIPAQGEGYVLKTPYRGNPDPNIRTNVDTILNPIVRMFKDNPEIELRVYPSSLQHTTPEGKVSPDRLFTFGVRLSCHKEDTFEKSGLQIANPNIREHIAMEVLKHIYKQYRSYY